MSINSDLLRVADIHQAATGGTGFFEGVAEGALYGAGATAVATANTFWNTGVSVLNVFGADIKEQDAAAWMGAIDSDMEKYYLNNKDTIDGVAFFAGSLIPGTLGIKALNAGTKMLRATKYGMPGTVTGKLLGLAPDALETYRHAAKAEIALGAEKFALSSKNTWKALAAGAGANFAEGLAFETFALASQFRAPVLQDKEVGDIVSDALTGNLWFGAGAGGFLSGVKTYWGVRKAASKLDTVINTHFEVPSVAHADAGAQVAFYRAHMDEIAAVPSVEEIVTGKVPGLTDILKPATSIQNATSEQLELAESLVEKFAAGRQLAVRNTEGSIQTALGELTAKDSALQQGVYNLLVRGDANAGAAFLDTSSVRRLGVEDRSAAAMKAHEEGTKYTTYVQLFGPEAGTAAAGAPAIWRVADKFADADKIKSFVASHLFADKKAPNYVGMKAAEFDPLMLDARNMWAARLSPIDFPKEISPTDIPLLKRAHELQITNVTLTDGRKIGHASEFRALIEDAVEQSKAAVRQGMIESPESSLNFDQLAHALDMDRDFLELVSPAILDAESAGSFFYVREQSRQHTAKLIADGVLPADAKEVQLAYHPKFAAVTDTPRDSALQMDDYSEFQFSASAEVAMRNVLAREDARMRLTAAGVVPADMAVSMPGDWRTNSVNRYGIGGGVVFKSDAGYGSVGAQAQHVGLLVEGQVRKNTALLSESFTKTASPLLDGDKIKLGAELGAINAEVRRSAESWVPTEGGLVLARIAKAVESKATSKKPPSEAQLAEYMQELISEGGKKLGSRAFIPVESAELNAFIRGEVSRNADALAKDMAIARARGEDAVEGLENLVGTYYPPRVDKSRVKYHAFVTDTRIGADAFGGKTMIHAATAEELQALEAKVRALGPHYRIDRGAETERWFQQHSNMDYERTLHTAPINQELSSAGVMDGFFVETDLDNLLQDHLSQHLRKASDQLREGVQIWYKSDIDALRKLDRQFADPHLSTMDVQEKAQAKRTSPGEDIIRTALGIPKSAPVWEAANKTIDGQLGKMYNAINKAWAGKKPPTDEELNKINEVLAASGVKSAYMDSATYLLANHRAGTKPITKFIRDSNAVLSVGTLGLDVLNAVNSAIGGAIMRSTELASVLRSIAEKDVAAVGELAQLDVAGVQHFTPYKLQAKATAAFVSMGKDHPDYEYFVRNGWLLDAQDTHARLLDATALTGTESAQELLRRSGTMRTLATQLANKGRTVTGNNLSEAYSRFTAAHVAKQITDLAIEQGVMRAEDAAAYITTFVNRTEGTLVASQRPVIFNGALGASISLFMTYQFNLIQQTLRHVGNGDTKALAYFLGLQGTFYGMNGLPGFAAINQHVIGQFSTNPEHRDAYDAVQGTVGKSLGNLLLYGLPSNMTQTSLYTRGDLTPRNPLLIPTSWDEIPAIGLYTKAIGMAKAFGAEAGDSGNFGHAMLRALEQNGVNRPLAGIATLTRGAIFGEDGTLQIKDTAGKTMMEMELNSLMQLTRITGAKPLEQARITDTYYRIKKYAAADTEESKALAKNLRNALDAGDDPSEAATDALKWHMQHGKSQKQFNQWMTRIMKESKEGQVEKLAASLNSPYAYKMQLALGGHEE